MSTLKDIAESLGVTVSTVSRALSGSGRISPEIQKKVRDKADELGYYPNESARVLKTGRSSVIGMIAPDITDVFYARLLKSISAEAMRHGFGVMYCDAGSSLEMEKRYYDMLLSRNVSGIIVATTGDNHIYDGAGDRARLVFVDNLPFAGADVCCVSIAHEQAGYDLTAHLLDKGCGDIAVITGGLRETSAYERLEGHRRCLRERGITAGRVYEGDYRFEGGYAAAKRILGEKKLPGAVVAHNHLLAYGAIAAFRQAGMSVPGGIEIACFDIADKDNIFAPRLTCVISPVDELGITAARLVIERINEEKLVRGRVFLDHTIVQGAPE